MAWGHNTGKADEGLYGDRIGYYMDDDPGELRFNRFTMELEEKPKDYSWNPWAVWGFTDEERKQHLAQKPLPHSAPFQDRVQRAKEKTQNWYEGSFIPEGWWSDKWGGREENILGLPNVVAHGPAALAAATGGLLYQYGSGFVDTKNEILSGINPFSRFANTADAVGIPLGMISHATNETKGRN